MSQIQITLRPPPNVDFVHGYPGIPPASPDRQPAAVKGALEVRVSPQGVKAKWVSVVLRKVETLPGGGQADKFYDDVGSPLYLWRTSEEFAVLRTQDFPFSIRIPEAIPPSIALEKGAGIKYELVAEVQMKGKRGLLRKRKDSSITTSAEVVMDKHELHSTWPVYCQPETRRQAQEGVTLTVDRHQSCYGPGDRVSVMATIKSDSLHTVILRGFEFVLRETTVFRFAHNTGKRLAPQVKMHVIGEQKVPVNVTLYGGTQHKAELACIIPQAHSTTSLGSARHIDVTYTIYVKALMGTGTHLTMDIPVMVSNWPRNVSAEAINRIGSVPALSLIPLGQPPQPQGGQVPGYTPSFPDPHRGSTDYGYGRGQPARPWTASSAVPRPNGYGADEFGHNNPGAVQTAITVDISNLGRMGNSTSHSGGRSDVPTPTPPASVSSGRRPRSAGNNQHRLTITNAVESEIPEESELSHGHASVPASAVGSGASSSQPRSGRGAREQWASSEEEKEQLRLYNKAREQAERVQVNLARDSQSSPSQPFRAASAAATSSAGRAPARNTPWPTAEEEKMRLFEEAQASVRRTQAGVTQYSGGASSRYAGRDRSGSAASGIDSSNISRTQSANAPPRKVGAALYSQGMSSMSSASGDAAMSSKGPRSGVPQMPMPQYASAEEEKAALKRYHEAKQAVDRVQAGGFIGDHTVDTDSSSADLPPSFEYAAAATSPVKPSWMTEKERLRRANEARDAATATATAARTRPNIDPSPPPAFDPPTAGQQPSWMSEKEKLRRHHEAQDAAALAAQQMSAPPPAFEAASSSSSSSAQPSWMSEKEKLRRHHEAQDAAAQKTDAPPPAFEVAASSSSSSTRPAWMSEKERLRRAYEAQDAAAMSSSSAKPPPPFPAPLRASPPPPNTPPTSGGSRTTSEKDSRWKKNEADNGYYNSGGQSPPASTPSVSSARSSYGLRGVPTLPFTNGARPETPPGRPPLMPRPPMEYIQQTREEDARTARLASPAVFIRDSQGSFSSFDLPAPPGTPPPIPPKIPLS